MESVESRSRGRLLIACPDQPGIIAAVSDTLFRSGGNIVSSDQYSEDPDHGMFFMRTEFELTRTDSAFAQLNTAMEPIAARFQMRWRLTDASVPKRMAIFVSKENHCLRELLWECQTREIAAKPVVVVSNHPTCQDDAAQFDIPFHVIPVTPETKTSAEVQALDLMETYRVDVIVLARYMQILSPDFIRHFPAQIINIHHSFLPAFVGPRPYHQAFARGVKLIGATAHYVTDDLDAGPIIEQDVQRVNHRHRILDLQRLGRHVERMVLARAVGWHVEDRVLVHQNRTVVFP